MEEQRRWLKINVIVEKWEQGYSEKVVEEVRKKQGCDGERGRERERERQRETETERVLRKTDFKEKSNSLSKMLT